MREPFLGIAESLPLRSLPRGPVTTTVCSSGLHPPHAGCDVCRSSRTIEPMRVKPSQIHGWDEEPVDKRPSGFSSTTGYSVLSGYHPMNDPARRRVSRSRFGLLSVLIFCALVLGAGVFAIVKLAPLLRI